MKTLLGFCALAIIGAAGWQLGGKLSSDAVALALGLLFGIMAGIPATLMVLAARRQDQQDNSYKRPEHIQTSPPPIIIINSDGNGRVASTTRLTPKYKVIEG